MSTGVRVIIVIGGIFLFILIMSLWGISVYNNMVTADKKVSGKWGAVEVQFNRKAKLYSDIVNAIKGAARNEDTTLIRIVQMRSRIPDIAPDQNNPQQLAEVGQQYANLGRSIMNINFENYPTLKTQDMFRDLQAQIEGTENRITTAIGDWNKEITDFNILVSRFPAKIWASIFGFREKENYKAPEGSNDVKIDFGS